MLYLLAAMLKELQVYIQVHINDFVVNQDAMFPSRKALQNHLSLFISNYEGDSHKPAILLYAPSIVSLKLRSCTLTTPHSAELIL
jgi:hypothetical protein